MPGPFPGMDPYLEIPRRRESFHDGLIFQLGAALDGRLPPGCAADFRRRVQIVRVPDEGSGRSLLRDKGVTGTG